jgi:hypothetical protein
MPDFEGRRWPRRSKGRNVDAESHDVADGSASGDAAKSDFDVDIVFNTEATPSGWAAPPTPASYLEATTSGYLPPEDDGYEAPLPAPRDPHPQALFDSSPVEVPLAPQPPPPPPISKVTGPVHVPQLVVGAASPDVEPAVVGEGFRQFPFRPDTVVDGWSNDEITVRAASLRGHFHRYNGAPRQDDVAVHLMADGRLVAVAADGVSAARQSHLGSSTVVAYAAKWLQMHAPHESAETDWMALVKNTAWALALQAQELLKLHDPDPGKAEQELATTMVCALVETVAPGNLRAFLIGVGDSAAWILRNGEFMPVLGGKAVGEGGISSSAVAGLPRVPNEIEPAVVEFGVGDVLLLGTDGFGDPLGSGQGGVGNLFRDLFSGARPPSLIEFAHALDFSRETFDDDRTLIAIMPQSKASEREDKEKPGDSRSGIPRQ